MKSSRSPKPDSRLDLFWVAGRYVLSPTLLAARFSRLLGLAESLLAQEPDDRNKLYAPAVVFISKGKAHKRCEFGCEVGVAVTNREGPFLVAMMFEGNPHDGLPLRPPPPRPKR